MVSTLPPAAMGLSVSIVLAAVIFSKGSLVLFISNYLDVTALNVLFSAARFWIICTSSPLGDPILNDSRLVDVGIL